MTRDFSEFSQSTIETGAAGGGANVTFDIKRFFYVRSPLMIIVAIGLSIPSVLGAWFFTKLEYEASATLQFLAVTPRVMYAINRDSQSASYEKYVNTQMSLIQNDTILNSVLDNADVAELPMMQGLDDPLEFLKNKVRVNHVDRNSELVRVSFRSSDRLAAKTIVTHIVSSYQAYTARLEADAGGKRLETLLKARDTYQMERERQLSTRADLARRLEAPTAGQMQLGTVGIGVQHEALVEAEKDHAKVLSLIGRTAEEIVQLEELQSSNTEYPRKKIYEFGIEGYVQTDPRLAMLRTELMARETELSRISSQRVRNSSFVKTARDAVNALKNNVVKTEGQVRSEIIRTLLVEHRKAFNSYGKDAEDALKILESRRGKIEKLEGEYEIKAARSAAAQAELDELDTNIADLGHRLSEVRKHIDALSLESNAAARVQLASPANVPGVPDSGKRLRLAILAFVASAGIGLGAGVLRELFDNHMYSPKDVRMMTNVPLIAAIPHTDEDPLLKGVLAHLVAAEYPYSSTANEYRRILAQIIYPPESGVETNSLLVVSPNRGDGKTSIACNLAIMLANANRRVLLVDTCSYAPKIEQCFGLNRAAGLSEVLYDGGDPLVLTRRTKIANLDVIGPGLHARDVSNKLASRDMIRMLDIFEHEYTHVILDTVPGLLMSDSKLLAPIVDGVLMVVGAGDTVRGMVNRFMSELQQVNAEIIGVVMNKIRKTRGGYLKQNLDMYYGYSDKAALLEAPGAGKRGLLENKPLRPAAKTPVGGETKSALRRPAARTPVGGEVKSAPLRPVPKTPVGGETKSALRRPVPKTPVGDETKSALRRPVPKTPVGGETRNVSHKPVDIVDAGETLKKKE